MIQQMWTMWTCGHGYLEMSTFLTERKLRDEVFPLDTHTYTISLEVYTYADPMWTKFCPHVDIASKLEGPHHDPTEGRRMTYGQKATPSQNMLYLIGQCIDCGNRRQSPGRPRCNECHSILLSELMSRG